MIKCKKCGLTVSYGADLRLRSNSEHFGFSTVKEWYQEQSEYVNSLDPCDYTDTEICKDDVKLFEVIPYKKKIKLGHSSLSLFGNSMHLDGDTEFVFSFDDVTAIAVLGRNKLNVYLKDKIYQIKSGKRFNALKYMNFYYRYANVKKGDPYGEFLGI